MLKLRMYGNIGLLIISFLFASSVSNAAAPNWASNYAGASLGQRTVNADWETTSYSNPNGSTRAFGTDTDASLNSSAIYFDAFIGKNWQVTPKVLVGVEARIGNAGNDKKHTTIPGADPDGPPVYSYVEVSSDLEYSVRGRVGYLVKPSVNVYGNLGLAALNVEASVTCPADTNFCNPANGTQANSETGTLTGWAAGIGVEAVFKEKWLVRGEYSYANYGKFSFDGLPAIAGVSYGFDSDIDFSGSTISVGVGYMF